MSFVVKEEKYSDEIDRYRDEIRRLKRMTTEEGANFEYLKNVVLTYMLRFVLISAIVNFDLNFHTITF
jgi:hypothetical protein